MSLPEFSISLLATFFSPLITAQWLEVISAAIFGFIVIKMFRLRSKYAWATPLLVGVLAFYLIPQPLRPAVSSAQPLPTRSGS